MAGVREKKKKSGGSAITFKKRKDCIKKKTMELSVLCDIKAIAIIVGPDGKIETWPESSQEVVDLIKCYQDFVAEKSANGFASTSSVTESEIAQIPGASNEFEACQCHGLATDGSNVEDFGAKVQEVPSTLNVAAAISSGQELDEEIEGWMSWDCLDSTQLNFDEWMNMDWDCSA